MHKTQKRLCSQGETGAENKAQGTAQDNGSESCIRSFFRIFRAQIVIDHNGGTCADHGIKGEYHPQKLGGRADGSHRVI